MPFTIQNKPKPSAKLLLEALEAMREGIIITDGGMDILHLNAATEKILGCTTRDDLAGKNLCEEVCGRQSDGSRLSPKTCQECRRIIREGKQNQRNVFFACSDGTLTPVRLTSTPFRENDQISAVVIALRVAMKDEDRESAKRSLIPAPMKVGLKKTLIQHEAREKKLQVQVEALQTALREIENLKLAIDQHSIVAITDSEGRITYANDNFCEISLYHREELLGQNPRVLNSGFHSPEFFKGMWATIGQGKIWKGEICNRSKNGQLYWLDTTIVPLLGDNGAPLQYVAIHTDITERKHAEEEIRRVHDAALEALGVKSEFLATVSHEIRTPMNGIIGVSELLLQMPLAEEVREYVEIIGNSADTLMHILNDILDFSKLESGKIEIDVSDFDLLAVIDFSLGLLAPRVYEKSLQLLSFIDPRLPPLMRGDAGRLRQILLNLVSNAIKFTAEGEIVVRAVPESETDTHIHVYFEIIDTGIGISPVELKRVFQPFTQADGSTTRQYGGTGLGLIITKRLVELMGGEIGVVSEKGRGSTFWFKLPFKRNTTTRERNYRGKSSDLSRVKILLADRNATNRGIFEKYLSSWGIECACVAEGKEALELLKRGVSANAPFGMAFLDTALTDMNVFSLAHAIREDAALHSTRLVLLSPAAYKQGETTRALKTGFEGCYTKPLKQSELLDCVESLTKGKESPKKFIRTGHYRVQGYEIINPVPPGLISLGRPASAEKALANEHLGDARDSLRSHHPLLLVEDHAINRLIAQKQLEELGLRVETAKNGKEAVTCFQQKTYALILMDCQMPLMDGFEATARIRELEAQHPSATRVPIIALTASISESDREKCIKAGMDDYLFKPVKLEKLKNTLRHWLKCYPKGVSEPEDSPVKLRGEVLDYKALDELRGIMGREFCEVVDIFLNETPRLIESLRESARQGQKEMVCYAAHKLKSSSANLGANGLSMMARELETKMHTGNMAGAEDNVANIANECGRVLEELAAYSRRYIGNIK